jgi:predicted alpha/beta hydrolase family esterase
MKVVIIHGAYGSPEENWIPWLKTELEKLDCEVIAPRFPTPKGQKLEKWLKILSMEVLDWSEDIIFIGHSLGPALILKKIEELEKPIKATFLVSGFIGELGLKEFDPINASFFEKGFDWEKIRQNCQKFFIYNSDNDPYVPLAKGEELANNLRVKLNIIHNASHINAAAGYTQFPKILEDIKTLL